MDATSSSSANHAAPAGGQLCGSVPPQPPARPKKRTGTSKYDFIKVKVWLGEDLDHYYILSRFLICRMLTVTRIPYIKAVKIALETKKFLVDNNLQDVTQAQLEDVLFSIVRAKGFDEAHIDCYRLVTRFYQSRQPLCIIICGAAWTGKSTLAQQLASRINIPNVMQTDVIYELLRAGPDSPLHPVPLWARPGLSSGGGRCCDAALVREFRREARVVREGMEGDLIKTLSDGKPIIIEGLHLDPGLYIPDFGSRGIIMLPARPTAAPPPAAAMAAAAAAAGGAVGGGSSGVGGRGGGGGGALLHAAAAAGRSPGSSPLAGRGRYGRSQTLPARGAAGTAAAAAAAAAAAEGAPQSSSLQQQPPLQAVSEAAGGQGVVQEQQPEQAQQQEQQQHLLRLPVRMASADAEVSVSAGGPPSPHSLNPAAAGGSSSVSAGEALLLLRQITSARREQQLLQQQQQRQGEEEDEPAQLVVDGVGSDAGDGVQQQQVSPLLPPLPPVRVRRSKQQQQQQDGDVDEGGQQQGAPDMEAAANGLEPGAVNGSSSTSTEATSQSVLPSETAAAAVDSSRISLGGGRSCPVHDNGSSLYPVVQQHSNHKPRSRQHQGTPFAFDALAAGAAAGLTVDGDAAAAAAANSVLGGGTSNSSNNNAPEQQEQQQQVSVVMLDEVQVCAAAAEAAALQQHQQQQQQLALQQHQQHQLLQQSLLQQHRQAPGSPFSSASDVSSLGVGGGGGGGGVGGSSPPCMSLEHSTTEVVSRVCSCASLGSPALPLSQEPSAAADVVWSPVAATLTAAGVVAVGADSPAASAAAAAGVDGVQDGGSGFLSKQGMPRSSSGTLLSGRAGHQARGSPRASSSITSGRLQLLQQLPEEQQVLQQQQVEKPQPAKQAKQRSRWRALQQQQQQSQQPPPLPSAVQQQQQQALSSTPASTEQQQTLLQQPEAQATLRNAGINSGTAAGESPFDSAAPRPPPAPPSATAGAARGAAGDTQGPSQASNSATATSSASSSVGKPLFVPILVYMDEADHVLMAEEALPHLLLGQSGAAAGGGGSGGGGTGSSKGGALGDAAAAAGEGGGGGGGEAGGGGGMHSCMHTATSGCQAGGGVAEGGDVSVQEALRRVRLLQEYLCAYEAQGLPVVKVSYGAFGEALDKLHEYVLQCIKVAMQSRDE